MQLCDENQVHEEKRLVLQRYLIRINRFQRFDMPKCYASHFPRKIWMKKEDDSWKLKKKGCFDMFLSIHKGSFLEELTKGYPYFVLSKGRSSLFKEILKQKV